MDEDGGRFLALDPPTRIGIVTAVAASVFLSFTPNISALGVIIPVILLFLWTRHHVRKRQEIARCAVCGVALRPGDELANRPQMSTRNTNLPRGKPHQHRP